MDLEKRLRESEAKFDELRNKRDEHLKVAEECLTEMTKLQGEYRLLQELADKPSETNKEATVIDAVPEEE